MINAEEILKNRYGENTLFEDVGMKRWMSLGKPNVFVNKTELGEFVLFYNLTAAKGCIVDSCEGVIELDEEGPHLYRGIFIDWDDEGKFSLTKKEGIKVEDLLKAVLGRVHFGKLTTSEWEFLGMPHTLVKSHTTPQGFEVFRDLGYKGLVVVDAGDVTYFEGKTDVIYRGIKITCIGEK